LGCCGRYLGRSVKEPAPSVNAPMSAEADAICGAPYGLPGPDRVNVRNGYRRRDFDTRAGTLDVAIPERPLAGDPADAVAITAKVPKHDGPTRPVQAT
jgi:hypothetical protein